MVVSLSGTSAAVGFLFVCVCVRACLRAYVCIFVCMLVHSILSNFSSESTRGKALLHSNSYLIFLICPPLPV